MKIIGIAGGSGSGKSTISYALVDSDPELFEVINLDDYQKFKTDPNLPMLDGMINWDHPDIIRWNDLLADIRKLQKGEPVTVNVWAHRSNPDYAKHGKMIPRTIKPKPIILVEGYLALYNPELNKLYDKAYYFDLDEKARNSRRGKNEIIGQDDYETKVLIPMHKQYVEPAKANADEVVDVSYLSIEDVASKLLSDLT